MKGRNNAFDLLCGLCILRMLMLHVVSTVGYRNEFWFGKLMAWTFFFLCFFFFKAGYFNKTVSGNSTAYFIDKAKRLLLPYVVWGAIGSVIYFGFLYIWPDVFQRFIKLFHWKHVWMQSHFYGNPPCWFLFSFFMTYILVHFLRKWSWISRIFSVAWVLLPFISYQMHLMHNPLWMSLSNVPMGLFMFQLGHVWHQVEERLPRHWFIGISVLMIIYFVHANHFWHGEYDMSLNRWVFSPWGCVVNIVAALCGLSGVLLSIKRLPRIPGICFVGEHSMVFFVLHYPLIFLYRFSMMLTQHEIKHNWCHFGVMLVLIFALCAILVPYIEQVPWLSGRWPKVKSAPNFAKKDVVVSE